MRTLNIGRSLYNINSFIGNEVVSDIHLGDWGMPISQIITYLEKMNIDITALNVKQLETIYPIASKNYRDDDDFKTHAQEINKLLNKNDQKLMNRQNSIKTYIPNGGIYVFKYSLLKEKYTYYSDKTYAYVMPKERSIDIDTQNDFKIAEFFANRVL